MEVAVVEGAEGEVDGAAVVALAYFGFHVRFAPFDAGRAFCTGPAVERAAVASSEAAAAEPTGRPRGDSTTAPGRRRTHTRVGML